MVRDIPPKWQIDDAAQRLLDGNPEPLSDMLDSLGVMNGHNYPVKALMVAFAASVSEAERARCEATANAEADRIRSEIQNAEDVAERLLGALGVIRTH